jgi:endonuclease III
MSRMYAGFLMALRTTCRTPGETLLSKVLAQRPTPSEVSQTISELRRRVKSYEDCYGIESRCLHQAIDEGTLVEDVEVGRWIFQYNLLLRAEAQ